jgi:hypothetical protein
VQQSYDSVYPATGLLLLEARGEEPIAIDGSAELGQLLHLLRAEPGERARLAAVGVVTNALLPVDPTPVEPDWMRAEQMLEEAAACPGERLFAQSLATAAQWHSAGKIAKASHSLALATEAGLLLPDSISAEAVRRGCAALEAAAARLPESRQARLTSA